MFRCYNCKEISEPKEPQHKVVVQKRDKIYTEKRDNITVIVGKGWEIVKEVALCGDCFVKSPFATIK